MQYTPVFAGLVQDGERRSMGIPQYCCSIEMERGARQFKPKLAKDLNRLVSAVKLVIAPDSMRRAG